MLKYAIDLPEESALAGVSGEAKKQHQFAQEKLACEQKAQQSASKTRDTKAIKTLGALEVAWCLEVILGTIFGASAGVPGGTALGAGTGATAGAAVGVAGRARDVSTPQGAFDRIREVHAKAGNTGGIRVSRNELPRPPT